MRRLIFVAATVVACSAVASAQQAKNVFLFISDGGGFNQFNSTAMYQYGFGQQPWEQAGWTKYAATTYPLTRASSPTGSGQDPNIVYDATKTWDTTPAPLVGESTVPTFGNPENSRGEFAGYNFTKSTFVDSAAAGTQIASGVKSYNNSINWTNTPSGAGTTLSGKTIAEIAKASNFATGVVSSVYFAHATPATTGGAHNVSRNNLAAIANQMLNDPTLDVILTPGHPEFNDAGQAVTYAPANANNIGGDTTWQNLQNGTHPGGWNLITEKAEFDAIANGTATPPARLIGLTQTRNTLQYSRPVADWDNDGVRANVDANGNFPFWADTAERWNERQLAPVNPGDNSAGDAYVSNVPSLANMTRAAINTLAAKQGSDGIYLMVEGAHIDWAGHGHFPARSIEENVQFNEAIEAALDWVAANDPDFSETLFIVTADHEVGMLWGPESDTVAFDPIVDNGIGNLPGMRFNSTQHTNQFVPLYARGVGAEMFVNLTDGVDPMYLQMYGMQNLPGWGNEYIDITDMFTVMNAVVPEPAMLSLLAGAGLLALRRRK